MFEIFKDLVKYKSLVAALVVRYLSSRYRGSVMGFLWTFLNPLCLMLVYTLVFKYYIRFDDVGNYSIFLFCGLLPWIWVQSGLIEGGNAIVSSGHLITKSMFPAHILPTVAIITNMINFVFSLPLLFAFMLFAGMEIHWTLVLVPLLVVINLLFLQGLAMLLASLNVHFRDIQHIVANLLTFLFFLCPILYPVTQVPERFRFTFDINPFALFTLCYQGLILNGEVPSLFSVGMLLGFTLASLLAGTFVYNRYRESFAELL